MCIFRALHIIPGWPAAPQIQAEKGGGGEEATARRGEGRRSRRESRGKGRDPGTEDRAQGSEILHIIEAVDSKMIMLIFSTILL